jgi:hypothetical protein
VPLPRQPKRQLGASSKKNCGWMGKSKLQKVTAKTTAERQRAFRASLKQQGLTEVRGIFAKPDQHQAVKDAVKKVLDSLATPPER